MVVSFGISETVAFGDEDEGCNGSCILESGATFNRSRTPIFIMSAILVGGSQDPTGWECLIFDNYAAPEAKVLCHDCGLEPRAFTDDLPTPIFVRAREA